MKRCRLSSTPVTMWITGTCMLGAGEDVCCINVSYLKCMNLFYIFFTQTLFYCKKEIIPQICFYWF